MMASRTERFQLINYRAVNRFIVRLSYVLTGVPKCTDRRLRNEIIPLEIPDTELELIKEFKDELQLGQVVYFSYTYLWILKGLYYPIYMVAAVLNIKRADGSDRDMSSHNNTYYGCLVTNCTRLSNHSILNDDLVDLPLFAICHPILNKFYWPMTGIHTIGLSIATVFIFFMFLIASYGMENHWHPKMQDSILFPVAPTYNIRTNRDRARRYLLEVFHSMQHYYCDFFSRSETECDLRNITRKNLILEYKNKEFYVRRAQQSAYLTSERHLTTLLESNYMALDQKVRDYLGHCLPMARSYTWAPEASEIGVIMWMFTYSVIMICFSVGLYYLMLAQTRMSEELVVMDLFVQAEGCAFWTSQSREPVVLNQMLKHNNWVYVFDYLLVLTPNMYIMTFNVTQSLASIEEIDFTLDEQLNHVDLAQKFAELLQDCGLDSCPTSGIDINSGRGCFNLDDARFYVEGTTWHLFSRVEPLTDDTAIETITKTRSGRRADHVDAFVDLMIKIHVKNRVIKDIARSSADSVTIVLSLAYAASYVAVGIVIFVNKKFVSSSMAPIALAIIGLLITNTIVMGASRVQSTTNRLIKSMWRLIATANNFKDLRVRHIRRLLIKQVDVLVLEGTLRIHAFGLPVTYASLFEAVIWSSTLAIFSFHG